jgi:hypothetical protein
MRFAEVILLSAALGLPFAGSATAQAPAGAPAGCALQIETQPSRWEISGFDPYASDVSHGSFELVFTNRGSAPCEGDVRVRSEGPAGLSSARSLRTGSELNYVLIDEYAGTNLTPTGGVSRPLGRSEVLRIAPGDRVSRRYSLSVAVDRLTTDGLFEDEVHISLNARDGAVLAERLVVLALDVTPSAVMGLRGGFTRTEGGGRIDLGELQEGGTNLPLQLWVRSTRGYRVSVASQNRGRLMIAEGSGAWWVPYTLSLGDRPINLRGGGHLDSRRGTGDDEDSYAISVVVGDVSNRRAGTYSDLIELTVAPL